jgi:hypothetical protein
MFMVMLKNLRRFLRHIPPPVILSEGAVWGRARDLKVRKTEPRAMVFVV